MNCDGVLGHPVSLDDFRRCYPRSEHISDASLSRAWERWKSWIDDLGWKASPNLRGCGRRDLWNLVLVDGPALHRAAIEALDNEEGP